VTSMTRHDSFRTPELVELLREHRIGLVVADTAGKWPYAEDVTADFVYLRLHGTGQIYAGGYSSEQLEWWARRIEAWTCGAEPPDEWQRAARAGVGLGEALGAQHAERDAGEDRGGREIGGGALGDDLVADLLGEREALLVAAGQRAGRYPTDAPTLPGADH